MKHDADVVVVGAGHAGLEAAFAARRVGASVILLTMREGDLGTLSCNPAIGGIGKGHLLREIDALDGRMARWGDRAGIQYRLLNASKGPAVRGPRTQIDRAIYGSAVREDVRSDPLSPTVVYGEVVDIDAQAGDTATVTLADGTRLRSGAVVLTTGTFLAGMIHIGDRRMPAGRNGDDASTHLAERLREAGLVTGRLKTGTPARLRRASIEWDILTPQYGDDVPTFLSLETTGLRCPQIACAVTATNARTHDIVRRSLHRSALFGGHVSGKGPRYCPSIEDKIVRFAEKDSHQIYLEPEGVDADLVYPNGISTSLPEDVQDRMIRSIVGLENVEIVRPGYAIEYDYCDPCALGSDLRSGVFPSLYLAGQINGTTGYEEAAAQGLVAGANAARRVLGREPLRLSRANAYIGVLIDDLTSRGVTEPYRMFTSRAEYRLQLRPDNAESRVSQIGRDVGLVTDEKWHAVCRRRDALNAPSGLSPTIHPTEARYVEEARAARVLYAPYLDRQRRDQVRLRENEQIVLGSGFDFDLPGLTIQQREILRERAPETLAQALKLEVMSPAAGLVLLAAARSR